MKILIVFLQAVFALVLLYYGAEFLVRGGVSIARRLKISPLVIGLTLVAFATSAPELVVSSHAAWQGLGDISLGNIIGSNICNIALILGLSALITPLPVNPELLRRDVPVMTASSLALAALCYFWGGVGRIAAGIFLLTLLLWIAWSIRQARAEGITEAEGEAAELIREPVLPLDRACLLVAGGLVALVLGGKLLVDSAVFIARLLHVSDAVIGLTVVAVGTSLPELATSIVAALRKESDIAVGNVIGSNIFNVLGILGIAPLLSPLKVQNITHADYAALLVCTLLLTVLLYTGKMLRRWEGGLLLGCYVLYTGYLVFSSAA